MADGKTILDTAEDNSGIVDNQQIDAADFAADGKSGGDSGNSGGGSFDYSTMVAADGALAENWRDGLPEDIRSEACLSNIKHVTALAKSFVSAQKMVGSNKIALPGEHATEEELNTFYKALGRPDKAEDYSVEGVKLPEGISLDDAQVKEFRDFAFKNGLSQKVFAAALAYDIERTRKGVADAAAAGDREYDDTLAKLQTAWGNDYQRNLAQCNAALNKWNLTDVFRSAGLLNNYQVITAMAEIGAAISESKLPGNDFNAPSDPQSQINAIINDLNHPFYKKDHPGHAAAVKMVNDLLAQQARLEKK